MTWCDYLTVCKYFPKNMVGSYDCSICPFFAGFLDNENEKFVNCIK